MLRSRVCCAQFVRKASVCTVASYVFVYEPHSYQIKPLTTFERDWRCQISTHDGK